MDAKTIGRRLTQLRGTRTLETVAKAIGISQSALSMYETGNRIPRDEIKIAIAKFYEISVEELFFAT